MIAIIGAGISGLTLAYELQKAGKPYVLFEATSRPGGYINTVISDNYLLEAGPNSILADADFDAFLSELGLDDQILQAAAVNKNRFIYKKGRIQKVPSGPLSLLTSSFFSFQTKKELISEIFKKQESLPDESINDFFIRRFSKEISEYVVDPFTTGVYAGDTKKLLIQETFPAIYALEQEYGSVVKGVFKKGLGGRRKTLSFKNGLNTLPETIASKLHSIEFNSTIIGINLLPQGIDLAIRNTDGKEENRSFNKVVFCGTTFHAAEIIKKEFPSVSDVLNKVEYAPMKALFTAFKRKQVQHKLNGFGVLYPSIEQSFLAGTIWNSSIFEGRCPKDEVLFTSFIGGAKHPEYTALSDVALKEKAIHQLQRDLQITNNPTFSHIAGWNKAIPQYTIALRNAREAIQPLKEKHIHFSSNWTSTIALGVCIQNAKKLALEL